MAGPLWSLQQSKIDRMSGLSGISAVVRPSADGQLLAKGRHGSDSPVGDKYGVEVRTGGRPGCYQATATSVGSGEPALSRPPDARGLRGR
jgi:hypothetical protein